MKRGKSASDIDTSIIEYHVKSAINAANECLGVVQYSYPAAGTELSVFSGALSRQQSAINVFLYNIRSSFQDHLSISAHLSKLFNDVGFGILCHELRTRFNGGAGALDVVRGHEFRDLQIKHVILQAEHAALRAEHEVLLFKHTLNNYSPTIFTDASSAYPAESSPVSGSTKDSGPSPMVTKRH